MVIVPHFSQRKKRKRGAIFITPEGLHLKLVINLTELVVK